MAGTARCFGRLDRLLTRSPVRGLRIPGCLLIEWRPLNKCSVLDSSKKLGADVHLWTSMRLCVKQYETYD